FVLFDFVRVGQLEKLAVEFVEFLGPACAVGTSQTCHLDPRSGASIGCDIQWAEANPDAAAFNDQGEDQRHQHGYRADQDPPLGWVMRNPEVRESMSPITRYRAAVGR